MFQYLNISFPCLFSWMQYFSINTELCAFCFLVCVYSFLHVASCAFNRSSSRINKVLWTWILWRKKKKKKSAGCTTSLKLCRLIRKYKRVKDVVSLCKHEKYLCLHTKKYETILGKCKIKVKITTFKSSDNNKHQWSLQLHHFRHWPQKLILLLFHS